MTSGDAPEVKHPHDQPRAEAPDPVKPEGEIQGYCVKCKESRVMTNVEMTRTKNGRAMAKGKCPVCGTTMTKFMKG